MNRPPTLLPEEHRQPAKTSSNRRGAFIMMWIILLLLSLVLVTGVVVVIYRPDLLGMELTGDLTMTSVRFQQTADALESTAVALEATGQFHADQGFDNESTRAALDNRQNVINQSGTQAALDIQGTQTAIAFSNAQQATRSALDFEGTQRALDRVATQVELEYQGTQAALNRDATAAVLGFATQAPSGQDVLTQTPPSTVTAVPLFVDGFATGISGGLWQFGAIEDWALSGDGLLTAQRSGAWLLTQFNDLTGYVFDVELLPLVGAEFVADYFILLNVQTELDVPGGMVLRLSYDGSRLTAAGLYRFTRRQMLDGEGLYENRLDPIQAVQVNIAPDAQLNILVELRGNHVVVVGNGVLLLDVTLNTTLPPGAVGLQVPVSTRIQRITLRP